MKIFSLKTHSHRHPSEEEEEIIWRLGFLPKQAAMSANVGKHPGCKCQKIDVFYVLHDKFWVLEVSSGLYNVGLGVSRGQDDRMCLLSRRQHLIILC